MSARSALWHRAAQACWLFPGGLRGTRPAEAGTQQERAMDQASLMDNETPWCVRPELATPPAASAPPANQSSVDAKPSSDPAVAQRRADLHAGEFDAPPANSSGPATPAAPVARGNLPPLLTDKPLDEPP